MLSGQVVRYDEQIEYPIIGPRWISAVYTPTLGADGLPDGWVAVVLDVTERKQMERSVRESEQRFARFKHHLPGLAWIKDLQGHYVYANETAMNVFGCTRDQLYGRTDDDVFPPETAAQFKQNDLRALSREAELLNGYEACRRIREQPWGKGILIAAATGWGQEDDRRRSREAGSELLIWGEIRLDGFSRDVLTDTVFGSSPLRWIMSGGREKEMVPSVIVEITWHAPGGRYHSPSIIAAHRRRCHAH